MALATARTDAVDAAQRVALNEGYQAGFLGGAVLALVGAVLALVLLSSRESREHAEAARKRPAGASAQRPKRLPERARRTYRKGYDDTCTPRRSPQDPPTGGKAGP